MDKDGEYKRVLEQQWGGSEHFPLMLEFVRLRAFHHQVLRLFTRDVEYNSFVDGLGAEKDMTSKKFEVWIPYQHVIHHIEELVHPLVTLLQACDDDEFKGEIANTRLVLSNLLMSAGLISEMKAKTPASIAHKYFMDIIELCHWMDQELPRLMKHYMETVMSCALWVQCLATYDAIDEELEEILGVTEDE